MTNIKGFAIFKSVLLRTLGDFTMLTVKEENVEGDSIFTEN